MTEHNFDIVIRPNLNGKLLPRREAGALQHLASTLANVIESPTFIQKLLVILSIPCLKAGAGLIYLFRGEQGSKEKGVVQRKIVVLRILIRG